MSYSDYKRNGQYWDIFNSQASQIWYHNIGNVLALQKANWADQDIADGFANYYRLLAYLQAHIEQPWLNELTKPHISVFPEENFIHTELGYQIACQSDLPCKYPTRLTTEQYQNIYDPIDLTGFDNSDFRYYDQRVNTLNEQLKQQGTNIKQESAKFNYQNAIAADKAWRGKTIDGYPVGEDFYRYRENEYGIPPYGFEGFVNLNETTIQSICQILINQYLENLTFQPAHSNHQEFAYARPINDSYQWVLLFTLRCPNSLLFGFRPHLLLCKNGFKKLVKPKDVVFQDDFFAIGGQNMYPISYERALYSQYFFYVNRSVQRYIDWIQPRILEVIDSFKR